MEAAAKGQAGDLYSLVDRPTVDLMGSRVYSMWDGRLVQFEKEDCAGKHWALRSYLIFLQIISR